jgi:DNA primase
MEGYFDVVTAAQYGYNASIATLGTAFTSEHLKLLNRYAEKLYIMYDGDAAGKNAILKLMQLCWNSPVDIFVVKFPVGDDPASFLLKNRDFSELIKQARDLFTFFAEELTENFFEKTVQERLVTVKKLLEGIATVTDPIKRDLLLQKTALVCNLPLERLENALNHIAKKTEPRKPSFVQSHQKMANLPLLTLLEKRLFCAILNKRTSLQEAEKKELASFLSDSLQDLLRKKEHESETPLTHDEKNMIAKIIIESEMENLSAAGDAVIEHFRKKIWKQKIQTLKMQLAHAQDAYDAPGVQQLLQEFESLKKKTVT